MKSFLKQKKLFPESDKSDPIFFCHIIPSDDAASPINPAINAIVVRPLIMSGIIIMNAPENPKKMPNH